MTMNDVFKKVVFLLGAGASKDAGCKLSSEMLNSLREAINNLKATEKDFIRFKEDFNEIYHFILASLMYQSTMKDTSANRSSYVNIEDFVMVLRQLIDKEFIIPYPLIGNWNDKILKWELRNGDVFNRFKDFITLQLVNDWTKFDSVKATSILQPIREMLNNSENVKMNIFSLNYDLIFENVFNSKTSKILDNGFSEKEILDQLFPGNDNGCLLDKFEEERNNWYQERIELDAKMFKRAKSLGYDAIVLIERTGREKLERNRKPRSIELNLLNV